MAEADTGAQPKLAYIDVDDLMVDKKYQRSAESDKSKTLIARIAREFHWSKFGPLIVSKRETGKYAVIDGQHRLQAVLLRGGIDSVPCAILSVADVTAEADSFIGINRDRVQMNPLAMFHALCGSGDKKAVALKKALAEINITVPRYPVMHGLTKPNECQAVRTLLKLADKFGMDAVKDAVGLIFKAYPETPGQMRSQFIKAITEIFGRWGGAIDRKRLLTIIGDMDPESLSDGAREYVKIEGGSTTDAMVRALTRAYNTGLKKADKLLREDGEA